MDQESMTAIRKFGFRLSPLFAVVLCLFAHHSVLAQQATIQLAQLTTTVKCNSADHQFVVFKASTSDTETPRASALGFALIPQGGELRMFARYSFVFDGKEFVKRDDDSGLKKENLRPVEKDWSDEVVKKFFNTCEFDTVPAVSLLAKNDLGASLDNALNAFREKRLQFKQEETLKPNQTQPLTNDDAATLAFATVIRDALQKHNWTTTPSSQVDLTPILTEQRKLETNIKSISDQVRAFKYLFIGAVILALTLGAIVVLLLLLLPLLRRNLFVDPETAATTNLKIQALETSINNLSGSLQRTAQDDAETVALRKFISNHFGVSLLDHDVEKELEALDQELKQVLLPLAADGSLSTLDRLRSASDSVTTIWGLSAAGECPPGALATLNDEWVGLLNALERFKSEEFKALNNPALEAIKILQYLNEKVFKLADPKELQQHVKNFFVELRDIYSEVHPNEASSKPNPEEILKDFKNKLKEHRKATYAFSTFNGGAPEKLSVAVASVCDQLTKAGRAVEGILPDETGTVDERVSALVAKFKADEERVAKATDLENDVKNLNLDLVSARGEADAKGRLAGILAEYVHLSPQRELDSSQIGTILGSFADTDKPHRQLRLRLSAAIDALDHAIADLNHAGRSDVFDALKFTDFRYQLVTLLNCMDGYRGEALWTGFLSKGFTQGWLSTLFRAELLAKTYFADAGDLKIIVNPLVEVGAALRDVMEEYDVHVEKIELLSAPPEGSEVKPEVNLDLKKIPEIGRKVLQLINQLPPGQDPRFIVDVGLFAWKKTTGESYEAEVYIASTGGWAK